MEVGEVGLIVTPQNGIESMATPQPFLTVGKGRHETMHLHLERSTFFELLFKLSLIFGSPLGQSRRREKEGQEGDAEACARRGQHKSHHDGRHSPGETQ